MLVQHPVTSRTPATLADVHPNRLCPRRIVRPHLRPWQGLARLASAASVWSLRWSTPSQCVRWARVLAPWPLVGLWMTEAHFVVYRCSSQHIFSSVTHTCHACLHAFRDHDTSAHICNPCPSLSILIHSRQAARLSCFSSAAWWTRRTAIETSGDVGKRAVRRGHSKKEEKSIDNKNFEGTDG